MKDGIMITAGVAAALIGALALAFTGGSLSIYRYWAPEFREAQREVFEQSPSYVQGKISHLARLRTAYEASEGNQRTAMREQILVEAATLDPIHLPANLRSFINNLAAAR